MRIDVSYFNQSKKKMQQLNVAVGRVASTMAKRKKKNLSKPTVNSASIPPTVVIWNHGFILLCLLIACQQAAHCLKCSAA